MALFHFMLLLHIAAGSVCLLTGGLAAYARKRKGMHSTAGEIYHAGYVVVFITAVVMAMMKWSEIAFLFYIALFSYGLALAGYLARKMRWRSWMNAHISGMLGSYIGIITAVLVVNGASIPLLNQLPPILLWFLPTIIGSPLIAAVGRRFAKAR